MSYYRDLLSNLNENTSQHGHFAASSFLHKSNESSTSSAAPTKNPSSLSTYESFFSNSSGDHIREFSGSLEAEDSELGTESEFDIFSNKRRREVVSELVKPI